ncbi:MAG: oxidoreductase [Nocardioidaceae bacterium]
MRPVKTLSLSTILLASCFLVSPAQAGNADVAGSSPHGYDRAPSWRQTVIDTDQSFRGLDAVGRRTAWVTGGSATNGGAGLVFRTTDGGRRWKNVSPPHTEGLLLRDVEARSAKVAVVLAIGPGDASRIYRTTNGGTSWDTAFVNHDPAAFYDCMAFYPGGRRGLALSDPVDGRFRILATRDSGRSWSVRSNKGMPEATTEAGFAASGDCLVTAGHTAYFGSGGGAARIFRSNNFGRTWTATDSTIPAGDSAGVFALAFRTPRRGIAVGGDFANPANGVDAVAKTLNGTLWRNTGNLTHLAEDVAYLPGHRHGLVATGESGAVMGTSVSVDGGRHWRLVANVGYHALDCTPDGSCWAAGGNGRVARLAR